MYGRKRTLFLSSLSIIAAGVIVLGANPASAVSGAAFTTFNAHVDGSGKDVCKNSAINCNLYGAKEYVWLNGGPEANGLRPDGEYFFAVLVPGGQPDPNDGGVKNLSDDYDCYHNRTFTITDGEVSYYDGDASGLCGAEYPFQEMHWLDSGKNGGGKKGTGVPDGKPPYIRLFPYADTTNPGGVYIMAICSLEDGYPVDPRDCKYDAFKVKQGKMPFQFCLGGKKFEDMYCDGGCTEEPYPEDPGLEGWKIIIDGTGPDGEPLHVEVFTDADGFWSWESVEYYFRGKDRPQEVNLTVCEELKDGWYQSCPMGCYTVSFMPEVPSLLCNDDMHDYHFGNWQPVSVSACKERPDEPVTCECSEEATRVEGWEVSLTEDGTVVDTQYTGPDGCYTWEGLICGITYDVHEGMREGWEECGPMDYVFERSQSGEGYSHTFCNAPLEGCTPGFWQGGSEGGQAGGRWRWDTCPDPDWGGMGENPYCHDTLFNDFFTPYGPLAGQTMWEQVNRGAGPLDHEKASRSLVAAYLNASWGLNYAYTTDQLRAMWADAVANGTFLELHAELDAANNAYYRGEEDGGPRCPISASGY